MGTDRWSPRSDAVGEVGDELHRRHDFFAMLRSGMVAPWLPAAHAQNEVVTRAAAARDRTGHGFVDGDAARLMHADVTAVRPDDSHVVASGRVTEVAREIVRRRADGVLTVRAMSPGAPAGVPPMAEEAGRAH